MPRKPLRITLDRHGRLYEVTEPNGVKTRYEYDVGNRLSKVCQGVTGTGTATCGQERLFNYDHRGFLISEKHPEKGGDGFVRYYDYDARGHASRKLDGPNDLTFTWDKAERLTRVRETGGEQRVLKSFTYGTSNFTDGSGVTDWRKGKVLSASRFNYVGAPFNATAEVRDTYLYKGAEGRASEHSRQLVFNSVDAEKFTTAYTYDGLGLVSSLSYPDCVAGSCAASDSPRAVAFSYSQGYLVSVPGYTGTAGGVSQITYHANGLVHQVPHANGVLYRQQNDPNGMMRPFNMTAARGATTLWTAGSHAYDGAGNVKATGAQSYLYDSLSRIRQSTISGTVQSYTYDNYGNLQSLTTGGSVLSTPTSSATNRLSGAFYDDAGNMTSWSGNTYQYDAFNQMTRYTSGAEDWVYVYGPDDERFWSYRTAGGGSLWTLRDLSGMVLRRYDSHQGWGTYQDYIYRGNLILSSHFSNGQQRHYDVDHLGTPRLITDAAGNQTGFHTYYPYGREQTALQEGDRLKFTGHERDLANVAEDGDDLDYMHARHYSLLVSRFLSTDRIRGTRLRPQSWNRYMYAYGNPSSYIDPNGLEPIPANQLAVLNSFFGQDFSHVNLNTGHSAAALTTLFGAWGVTFGNEVYLSSEAVKQVMSGSYKGIEGLAHELVHVNQYAASRGVLGFLNLYAKDAVELERIAYRVEDVIARFLAQNYTSFTATVCTEDGQCFAYTDWIPKPQDPRNLFVGRTTNGIALALVGSPYDQFLAGGLCIEGICL